MRIPDSVKEESLRLGIAEEDLVVMIAMSAPVTHELGNRRYEDFIFLIQDGIVEDINRDGPQKEYNCPDCEDDGDYCLSCWSD